MRQNFQDFLTVMQGKMDRHCSTPMANFERCPRSSYWCPGRVDMRVGS